MAQELRNLHALSDARTQLGHTAIAMQCVNQRDAVDVAGFHLIYETFSHDQDIRQGEFIGFSALETAILASILGNAANQGLLGDAEKLHTYIATLPRDIQTVVKTCFAVLQRSLELSPAMLAASARLLTDETYRCALHDEFAQLFPNLYTCFNCQ